MIQPDRSQTLGEPIEFLPRETTLREYAGRLAGGFPIPVITPRDPIRAARWRNALRGAAPIDRSTLRTVAATGELAAVAAALSDRGAGKSCTEVVGFPRDFGVRTQRQLHERLGGPTLVTGRDLAALTFVIAKALTRPPSRPETDLVLIEKLTDRPPICITIGPAGLAKSHPDEIPELVRRPCRTLVLMAHGEGSHVNLGSVALCSGIGSPAEAARLNADVLCGEAAPDRWCRKAGLRYELVSPAELQAETVVFVSCNVSAMCGEIYPTSQNLVLSSLDGATRTVVASSAATSSNVWDIELIVGTLRRGGDAHDLCAALNELQQAREGFRSFVSFGARGGSSATASVAAQPLR